MNKLDKQYTDLLQDILDNGVQKKDRTGTGTISVFGRQIRHNMKDGFPLLTTKKMPFKTIVTELLWFLRGNTNIKYLVDNNCHIWDGDAYKRYINYIHDVVQGENQIYGNWYGKEEFINKIKTDDEFAKKWGELGPIYGAGWRRWNSITKKWWNDPEYQGYGSDSRSGWEYDETQIDQIQNLINDLKTNPDSRRLMVNAWNVGELDQMVLPPCHYGFQVYTRELSYSERRKYRANTIGTNYNQTGNDFYDLDKYNIPTRAISLMWNQRSVDTFLGLPFNIASYGLLLEIIAKEVNMVPEELIGNLGDVHLYSNHIDAAKEQIGRLYTSEERYSLLKESMGDEAYENAVEQLEAFGGGLSEYYDLHKIPYTTREPFPLPTLNINTEFWKTQSGECGVGPLDTNLQGFEISDFEIENYQSHPTIKAPLSN
jgi:thymidylate synthase